MEQRVRNQRRSKENNKNRCSKEVAMTTSNGGVEIIINGGAIAGVEEAEVVIVGVEDSINKRITRNERQTRWIYN